MIAARWRLALIAKALLLLAIAGGFGWLGYASIHDPRWPIKALGGVGFTALGMFIAWAGGLGLADALLGQTRTEGGVRVLESRRQGYSMRAPSGRFVEFILWNPWGRLEPGTLYRVTYGRFSGVIVQRPEAERPTEANPSGP